MRRLRATCDKIGAAMHGKCEWAGRGQAKKKKLEPTRPHQSKAKPGATARVGQGGRKELSPNKCEGHHRFLLLLLNHRPVASHTLPHRTQTSYPLFALSKPPPIMHRLNHFWFNLWRGNIAHNFRQTGRTHPHLAACSHLLLLRSPWHPLWPYDANMIFPLLAGARSPYRRCYYLSLWQSIMRGRLLLLLGRWGLRLVGVILYARKDSFVPTIGVGLESIYRVLTDTQCMRRFPSTSLPPACCYLPWTLSFDS